MAELGFKLDSQPRWERLKALSEIKQENKCRTPQAYTYGGWFTHPDAQQPGASSGYPDPEAEEKH